MNEKESCVDHSDIRWIYVYAINGFQDNLSHEETALII